MAYVQRVVHADGPPTDTFEDWAEQLIAEIQNLVREQGTEMAALRRRVVQLERSAGRTLIHPNDLLGEAALTSHDA